MKLWLGGSTIVIPTVIAMPVANRHLQGVFSLGPVGRGSWRTPLLWLMLSHIGTDVLDECVSSCQGALREYPSTPYYNFQGPKRNLYFPVTFYKIFSWHFADGNRHLIKIPHRHKVTSYILP